MQSFLRTTLVALALPAVCSAQTATGRQPNTYRFAVTNTAPASGPEVRPDRTVTFQIGAPEASKVELFLLPQAPKPMTKNADGVWSITVGPLEPEIYRYHFVVNGVHLVDMSNPAIDIGRSGAFSTIDVPGSPARVDEPQQVPHGTLHIREYTSAVLNERRHVYVYVPSQYDTEPTRRFPVLYLRHGNGDLEGGWSGIGRAGTILDNLIAQRKAVPMIIVMPNGYPSTRGDGSSAEGVELTAKELMNDIIPMIEEHYRILDGRDNRAIAGLSMGGGQAFLTGLRNPDKFAWVAEFSSGTVSDVDFKLEKAVPGFLEDPSAANTRVRLLFLSCGTEDPRYPGHLDLVDKLTKYHIRHEWFSTPGAHEWKVWRNSLAELLQKLFERPVKK